MTAFICFGALTVAHMERKWMTAAPGLNSAVNSSPLNNMDEYNVEKGQTHSLPAEAHGQKPADLSGLLKTLKHSRFILRFMLHLCPVLAVIWLIK